MSFNQCQIGEAPVHQPWHSPVNFCNTILHRYGRICAVASIFTYPALIKEERIARHLQADDKKQPFQCIGFLNTTSERRGT